jgi:hypothetical protein
MMPEGCWVRSTVSLPSSAASAAIHLRSRPRQRPRGSPIEGLRFGRERMRIRGENSKFLVFYRDRERWIGGEACVGFVVREGGGVGRLVREGVLGREIVGGFGKMVFIERGR